MLKVRAEVKNSGEKKTGGCAKGFTGVDEHVLGFDELAAMFLRLAVFHVHCGLREI